ncbi:MAG: hypothetical protein KGO49_12130 [Gammaproteobacteria bacterium]|nr:hypothetical protein [Gammaproteobacteria bacterium]
MTTENSKITLLVRGQDHKPLKSFPIRVQYAGEAKQLERMTDQQGKANFSLEPNRLVDVSVLTPDGSFEKNATINTTKASKKLFTIIGVGHKKNDFIVQLQIKMIDLNKKPVPHHNLEIILEGNTSTKKSDQSGIIKQAMLVGELIRMNCIDLESNLTLVEKFKKMLHVDEYPSAYVYRPNRAGDYVITVTLPMHVHDSSTEPDKPTTQHPSLIPPSADKLITIAQMKTMWPKVKEEKMKPIMDELNNNINDYRLNTPLRKAHFFAQIMQEVGPAFTPGENLNYRPHILKKFSYYRKFPNEAERDGLTNEHAANVINIANNAYNDAYRPKAYKLGNTEKGDGWKYRGRGLKQLTGRSNYTSFNNEYPQVWSNENINFVEHPELLEQPKYAARSAVWYWLKHDLASIADSGESEDSVNKITAIINKATDSYAARRMNFSGSKGFVGTKNLFR